MGNKNPFDLTASEAFAKGDVGDSIEHVNGEKFDITVNGTIILAHLDVNKKAFRVIYALHPTPVPSRRVMHFYQHNIRNVILYYKGGAEVRLPADVVAMSYIRNVNDLS